MTTWHEIEKDGFPTESGWYQIIATFGTESYETTDYYDADKREWNRTGRVSNRILEYWTEIGEDE